MKGVTMEGVTWVKEFGERIGIQFRNKKLVREALVHRSYLNENRHSKLKSNERLEFLGDKILSAVIAEYLYQNYQFSEGMLTDLTSSLVNTQALAEIAEKLELDKYLLMSRGQRRWFKGRSRSRIMAGTLEALIGAIYLDRGWGAAEVFVTEYLTERLPMIIQNELFLDPKSKLQELAQEMIHVTPKYQLIEGQGPDHDKLWTVGVFFEGRLVAQGRGPSKKEAEENAAEQALKKEFQFRTQKSEYF